MSIIRQTEGYCPCCRKNTTFIAKEYWLRDHYLCSICHSKPRNRALSKVIKDLFPNYETLRIHESSPSKRQIQLETTNCANYTYSYFYEDIPLGTPLKWGGG